MTPEEIVTAAVALLAAEKRHPESRRIVEDALDRVEVERRALRWERSARSEAARKAIKALDLALTRVILSIHATAESDFPDELARLLHADHFKDFEQTALQIQEGCRLALSAKPLKRSSADKRAVAKGARWVLLVHEIEVTSKAGGPWCKLAAIMYGDPDANLREACRAVEQAG
jgi:hypothetical protein